LARALSEGPDGYDALTGMGIAAYRQGDTKGAQEAFRRAAVLFPEDSLVRWYLGRLPESYADVKLAAVVRPAALRVDAPYRTPGLRDSR
jgi:Flp pilus assembly protein TadD